MQKGYTLIETVVMLAVLAVVGGILTDSVTQIFRGQNKAVILSQVKQNGQVALDQIVNTIKTSDRIVCGADASYPNKLVLLQQGVYTRIMFNTVSGTDENNYLSVDKPDPLSSTSPCDPFSPTVSLFKLTNSNPVSGVNVVSGSFNKLSSQTGNKDLVTVQFTLGVGKLAKTTPENQANNIPFQTTVGLR